jgi:hypothetical protein
MHARLAACRLRLSAWYYRAAPFLMVSFIDDPAMLALVFC